MGKSSVLSGVERLDGLTTGKAAPTERADEFELAAPSHLVSVVIPTHNRPDKLQRAVESALNQSYQDLEVIIVDDGSDPPVAIAPDNPRVRLIRNEVGGGAAKARNIGIRAARGHYICFLDDDDYYMPDKLAKQVDYLRGHPGIDMVFSNVICDDGNGVKKPWLAADHTYDQISNLCKNRIHTNATLLRRHVIDRITFAEDLSYGEDAQFYGRISLNFNVAYLPEIVATWHRDPRADRLTLQDRDSRYRSYQIFVKTFERVFEENKELCNRHYGRLAYMALRLGNLSETRNHLAKLGLLNGIVQVVKFYLSTKREL